MAAKKSKPARNPLIDSERDRMIEWMVDTSFSDYLESVERLRLTGSSRSARIEERAKTSPELKAALGTPTSLPLWGQKDYLKRLREEAGVSQHQLAKITGISRSVIANYEVGVTTFNLGNAVKLYTALEALGSKEATKILVSVALYHKEMCHWEMEYIDGELKALRKRREALEDQVTSLESFMEMQKEKSE
jgi:transcriptional regulator with XRE-family HTH domain